MYLLYFLSSIIPEHSLFTISEAFKGLLFLVPWVEGFPYPLFFKDGFTRRKRFPFCFPNLWFPGNSYFSSYKGFLLTYGLPYDMVSFAFLDPGLRVLPPWSHPFSQARSCRFWTSRYTRFKAVLLCLQSMKETAGEDRRIFVHEQNTLVVNLVL